MVETLLQIHKYEKHLDKLLKKAEKIIKSDANPLQLKQVVFSLTEIIEENGQYTNQSSGTPGFKEVVRGSVDLGVSARDLMLEGVSERYRRALELRGEVYASLGRFDESANDLGEAIKCGSQNSFIFYLSGYSNWKLGMLDKALENLAKAMIIAPQQPEAYVLYATVLEHIGEFREALGYVNKAIDINPKHQNAFHIRALVNLRLGEFKKSIIDSKKAIELDRKDVSSYNNLGFAHLKLGKFNEAIANLNEAIRLCPELIQAYSHLGRAYQCNGDMENAKQNYKVCLIHALGIEINQKNKNQLLAAIGAERGLNEMGIKTPVLSEDGALEQKVLTVSDIKNYLSPF